MSAKSRVRVLRWVATGLAAFLVFLLISVIYISNVYRQLPDLATDPQALHPTENSIVYAADGSILTEWHDSEDRTIVPASSIPEVLKDATIAIEDRRFYEHNGVDAEAIVRAFTVNYEAGEVRQGGSTITQQTVKMLLTGDRRTLDRKLEEALLALSLETQADKEELLGVYLNTVYFGHGSYGVESAARHFFGVGSEDLQLAQAALLAGCIQSPSRYDPFVHPAEALERRNTVLRAMRQQRYITPEEFARASAQPLGIVDTRGDQAQVAPYFVEYVRRQLTDVVGAERLSRGGLRIYTTLEPAAQAAAEKAARSVLPSRKDPEVAVASVRWRDGSIVALVGGRDFAKEKFDLATQGKRQTGSAFKPFVLAAALEGGYTLDSRFDATPFSTPVRDGIWHVDNYENGAVAPSMTLRTAMVYSVNTVFARLIMRVGPKSVVKVAKRMGITTPIAPEPAIALGGLDRGVSPLEMASAFGTIANQGVATKPTAIFKVTDANGDVIYQPPRKGKRAISKKTAATLASVLNEVYAKGTGIEANFGQWAAVKTGTAQSWRDAWIVGYSGDLSTAVWVGYPEAQIEMTNVRGIRVTGGSFPAKVWKSYMAKASKPGRRPPSAAANPSVAEEYDTYRVCTESHQLARPDCPEKMDLVIRTGGMSLNRCTLKH